MRCGADRAEGPSPFAGVRLPGLVFPKSSYINNRVPLPIYKERKVLETFLENQQRGDNIKSSGSNTEFTQYELHTFSIYRPESKNSQSGELAPLNHLCAKSANNAYYFDGVIVDGNTRRYVQKVPFDVLSVGNYLNTDLHTVGDQVWIQSLCCKKRNVWYQLKDPAPEYKTYHNGFLWIANFTKYFVDFLNTFEKVTLQHFRQNFNDWLAELHGTDTEFQHWFQAFNRVDFRTAVAANVDFLWKEACGVDEGFSQHPVWAEVDPKKLTAVKERHFKVENTVVTPYVYECFRRLTFGIFLNTVKQSPGVLNSRREREIDLDLTVGSHLADLSDVSDEETDPPPLRPRNNTGAQQEDNFQMLEELYDEDNEVEEDGAEEQVRIAARAINARAKFGGIELIRPSRLRRDSNGALLPQRITEVLPGDVVMVKADDNSVWKGKSEHYFAYIQDVHMDKKGRRRLKVIWLYQPSETSCADVFYPIHNELFLSDHCNCEDPVLDAGDVLFKPSVAFFSKPGESSAEYFVRQKYNNHEASFVTLKPSDFRCEHYKSFKSAIEEAKERYAVNDTVYITTTTPALEWSDTKREIAAEERLILEPVQVVRFTTDDQILVRRLARRSRDYCSQQGAHPNELIYTETIYPVAPDRIERKCHVRYYSEEQKEKGQIPVPYCRDGTADAFYIICREVDDGEYRRLEPLTAPFPAMNEGFDPTHLPTRPLLNGMDLFCGGGSFGRGLEEGGAIKNKWAVDIGREQIHTYRANLKDTADTKLFFGSVNDVLKNALRGRFSEYVPEPGEVDFISAGSPCQGFSNANNHKGNETALRNCSLVASVAAFVDFYRPKYALLENVHGMASGPRDQNVFSQLLCALVGMGYQVQQFNLDAWSFGSPQSRSRLFVSIAAPGLTLPSHPPLTHRHPISKKDRSIGTGSNGIKFGQRRFQIPVFEYVTAAEGTKDLPYIGQARTGTCISFPDHRPSSTQTGRKCVLMSCVPVNPREQSFIKAAKSGCMPRSIISEYSWGKSGLSKRLEARSWQRVHPDLLMGTIKTAATAACAFTGSIMHWDEHRILTVQEARRAQSYPDHEVLIGVPSSQWKIVGNSVARTVALSLGMSLRGAWLNSDDSQPGYEALTVQVESGLIFDTSNGEKDDDEVGRRGYEETCDTSNLAETLKEWDLEDWDLISLKSSRERIKSCELTDNSSLSSVQKRKRDDKEDEDSRTSLKRVNETVYIDLSSDDNVGIEVSRKNTPNPDSLTTNWPIFRVHSPSSPRAQDAHMSASPDTDSRMTVNSSPIPSQDTSTSISAPLDAFEDNIKRASI